MSVPVIVERENGKFVAAVLGHPTVRAEAPTRDAAVAQLRAELNDRSGRGELVWIDVIASPPPVRALTEEERESLREMTEEIYRERDAQKAREFPE